MKVKSSRLEQFDKWLNHRTSYTLRAFTAKDDHLPIISIWDKTYTSDIFELCDLNKILNDQYTKYNNLILPTIHFHKSVKGRISVVNENLFIEFLLSHDCILQWMPWPSNLLKPTINNAQYVDISPVGKPVTQPRKTVCYGSAYQYSGKTHPMELMTPSIQLLINWINTNAHLPEKYGVNMCLANSYDHGRHAIGEHQDSMNQMNHVKDVYCFCVGDARELVLRTKDKGTPKEREVLRIMIPEGLYIMHGEQFQKYYTHEFPEVYPALFKYLQKILIHHKDYPNEPILSEHGANRLHLVQADWMVLHADEIRKLL